MAPVPAPGPGAVPLPDYTEQVLDVVDRIPPGRVMSYGAVAAEVGRGGPRQVGRVMALWGGAVAWWRVTHADGSFLRGHRDRALSHYLRERTPLRRGRDGAVTGVDMALARWAGAGEDEGASAGPG